MNEVLAKAISKQLDKMGPDTRRALLEDLLSAAAAERSVKVLGDYIAGLEDPDSIFNIYADEDFVDRVYASMRGDRLGADDKASGIADNIVVQQLKIMLGMAPEQNYKRRRV